MPPAIPPLTELPIPAHLQPYQVPPANYAEVNGIHISRLVASAVVIHCDRVLLLQRAAHSFQPLLWELPGGRCELHDESVIITAARELWEESGLIAKKFIDMVGQYQWHDHGEVWKKGTFLVDVEHEGNEQPEVIIDPKEQEAFIWATEDDISSNKCGGIYLNWTSQEQRQIVLDAFKLRKCYDTGSTVCGKPESE